MDRVQLMVQQAKEIYGEMLDDFYQFHRAHPDDLPAGDLISVCAELIQESMKTKSELDDLKKAASNGEK